MKCYSLPIIYVKNLFVGGENLINKIMDMNQIISKDNNINILESIKLKDKNSKLHNNKSEDELDKELMEACKSFETYFVEQVLKEMRKTVEENENNSYSYFNDLLYREYAGTITKQGELGLSQTLYESMKRDSIIDIG